MESLEEYPLGLTESEELAEIEDELCVVAYGKRKKARSTASKPHAYTSSTGWKILIGRNNKQNDLLTMKMASARDLWFHAQNAGVT